MTVLRVISYGEANAVVDHEYANPRSTVFPDHSCRNFQPAGFRKRYYRSSGADALILTRLMGIAF